MPVIRPDDARAMFEASISLSRNQVDAAKQFVVERVPAEPTDGRDLIRSWWAQQKAPPVDQLTLHDDYDFPEQCRRTARHWQARLCAAQALKELVADGYLDSADGAQQQTERVTQGYTTVVERSGGTSGGWDLRSSDVLFPSRVRKGAFAKPFTPLVESPTPGGGAVEGPSQSQPMSMTAIADPDVATEILGQLENLARRLGALAESNVLSEHSQELLVDVALPLLAELRDVLTRVAADEAERLGLVKASLVGIGKTAQTLAMVGRFAAGIGGLGKVPEVVEAGIELVESIAHSVG